MQSQLTRRIFRAILNNEPLPSFQCRKCFTHSARLYRSRRSAPGAFYVQRRGLFAFSSTPPSAPPSSILRSEVGLQAMRELERSITYRTRGPGSDVLAKAFEDFFETRAREPGVITLFHAHLLVMTWRHLHAREHDMEPEDWQRVFSVESLDKVLFVLSEAECLPDSHTVIRKLARYAFLELRRAHDDDPNQIARLSLLAYIKIQALMGNPEDARHTVEMSWSRLREISPSPWLTVIRGFAMADDRRQIRKTVENLGEYGVKFDPVSQEELVEYLIDQDLPSAVKTVYECQLSEGEEPTLSTKIAVSRYAILKSDIAWARPIFESTVSGVVPETIGIRLLWDAAHGNDASDISRNVELWAAKDAGVMGALSVSHVNDLIAYANTISNPMLAAAFRALAPKWGLTPDLQTQLLYLESRIQAGDVGEALFSLESLGHLDMAAPEYLPLMNKLITMLCFSGHDDATFDRVSSFLDPLFEKNVRLQPDTLAAITHILVHRRDWEGVSELLRPRLGSYDSEGKTKVRNVLTDFILDVGQEADQAWEAYGLLQHAFPETGVSMRTKLMTSFFKRGKSDLAYLIFGHMRQADHFENRPKPDTYARCFQGFVQTRDLKHLELVHNMLKLDTEFDLNTRLLNWLMLAYAECDKPEKSMEIFRDILQSEEGPSRRTLSFFFKVCMKHHNGSQEAIKMMKKMKLLEIQIDRHLYMGYVEALAAQCEFHLATEALDKLEEMTGYPPTYRSIGRFYNAIPYQYWKDEVEKWARGKYPDLWAELEGIERTEYEEGPQFKLQGANNDESLG
ncbi:hypothetical protein BJX61DRAFT_521624 [Aspergillus egyptiacus]|nr:hypothetical protein BJX61DRAFT_521624 [Aspergillus egyptiacus]